MKCEHCLWSKPTKQRGHDVLTCHFSAPSMICGTGTGWSDWEWPVIAGDDFCNEWRGPGMDKDEGGAK